MLSTIKKTYLSRTRCRYLSFIVPLGSILVFLLLSIAIVNPDSNIINNVYADDSSNDVSLLADTSAPSASFSYSGSLDLSNTGAITGDKTNTVITMTNNITVEARLINNYNLQISGGTSNSGSGGSSNNSSTTLEGPTTINPIDNTTNPSTFNGLSTDNMLDNTWGYSWGNTSTNSTDNSNKLYKGITTTPVTIDNTSVDSNGTVRYTKPLTFAAKFSKDALAGHYTTTVTLSLAAAPKTLTTYTLAYDTQGASNTIPNTTCSTYFDSCNVTITNTVPTRTNYTFLGWADTNTATSAQYTTNGTNGTANTITLSAATTTNKAKTIYAVWESQDPWASITTMQQMTTAACDAAEIGKSKTLVDDRDHNSYKVEKFEDGRCWMTSNLELRGSRTLTPTDTNVNANYSLPANDIGKFGSSQDIQAAYYTTASPARDTGYYSWCTATAGTCSSATSTGSVAPSSICPMGWRLPYGGTATSGKYMNEFYNLIINVLKLYAAPGSLSGSWNFTDTNASATLRSAPYNFAYTGNVYGGSFGTYGNPDSFGSWWSATAFGNTSAYHLYIINNKIGPGTNDGYGRNFGFAIRCINNPDI